MKHASTKKPPLLKRLLHRIFPPAPDFFSLLNDQCDLAVESTAKLVEFMAHADPAVGAEIRKLEHAGDRLKERNMDVLNRAFATVVDRDDIDRAIRSIDEILNYAKSTVREMEALHVTPDPAMAAMAGHIKEGTEALRRGYAKLAARQSEAAEAEATAAHKAERHTETIYREALSHLFDYTRLEKVLGDAGPEGTMAALQDVVFMFRHREIYRHLSNTADRVALAGAYLHDTIVKAI